MSRWTGRANISNVLSASDTWREKCFLANGSLFTEDDLWTAENMLELKSRCIDNPIEGGEQSFAEKLSVQLSGAPKSVIQLAAEILWLLTLFPRSENFHPNTKRSQVRDVWELSGTDLPQSSHLSDEALDGVGNPGLDYTIRKYDQFSLLIEVMLGWKAQSAEEQNALVTEDVPWKFLAWLDSFENSDRPVRHAILYFLFPDKLERIMSSLHRSQIVAALKHRLPEEHRPRRSNPSLEELDRAISQLREIFEKDFDTTELDFYRPPINSLWFTSVREKVRAEIGTELKKVLSVYGLELRQCGSKKKTLDVCKPVDESTGFWSNPADATNKPVRWFLHLELEDDRIIARVPKSHGARRIAFANTAQGNSGAIATRIIPAIKLTDEQFVFYETWEWLLLHCFLPALPTGSSGQLFENFDETSGKLTYMGKEQAYIVAGLITLQEDDNEFVASELHRSIMYGEATQAISQLIQVSPIHSSLATSHQSEES